MIYKSFTMKHTAILVTFLLAMGFASFPQTTRSIDYKKRWEKVEKFKDQGLPRSALKEVKIIFRNAKEQNQPVQYLKALLNKLALQSQFEIDYNEKAIIELQTELQETNDTIQQNMLHSMLAELFWNYYRQNRYQISERSAVPTEECDIKTWDASRLLDSARHHYQKSLNAPKITATVNLRDYNEVMIPGENTSELRPSLFDFLAYRALDFIKSNDYLLSEPNEQLVYHDTTCFEPVSGFIARTFNPENFVEWPLWIFQQLLQLHQQQPAALAEANLQRLSFVAGFHSRYQTDGLLLNALKHFAQQMDKHPEKALLWYEIARIYAGMPSEPDSTGNLSRALEYCQKAINQYPDSFGASKAHLLKNQILEKSLTIEFEPAYLPGEGVLARIAYKNLDKIYLRVIPVDFEGKWADRPGDKEKIIQALREKKPLIEKRYELNPAVGFQITTTEIILPELEKGYYVVLAGSAPDFSVEKQAVAYASFWVTRLAFISSKPDLSLYEVRILDRDKGKPVKQAEVICLNKKYNRKTQAYDYHPVHTFIANNDGKIFLSDKELHNGSFYLDIRKNGDRYVTKEAFYLRSQNRRPRTERRVVLFTDREIYRPGQTVYFKGYALEKDTAENSHIIADYSDDILFLDVNRQLVAQKKIHGNDMGTFTGSFTIPDDPLTGKFSLKTHYGSRYVYVEAYKRPRFEVTIDTLGESYALNENITLSGHVEALAGYPLEGAVVRFKVTRQVRFPYFFGYLPFGNVPPVVLQSGETKINAEGQFFFSFLAEPDYSFNKKYQPVFDYQINVEAVDVNGETHESHASLKAGYQRFNASMEVADSWNLNKPLTVALQVKNLSGRDIPFSGHLMVEKLQDFEHLTRNRLWERPDYFMEDKETYAHQLPGITRKGENQLKDLKVDKRVFTQPLQNQRKSVILPESWEPGAYKITLKAVHEGETQETVSYLTLFDPNEKRPPLTTRSFFDLSQETAAPGEQVKLLVASADKPVNVFIRVFRDKKELMDKTLTLRNQQHIIEIPVTENMQGGFDVTAAFFKDNRFYSFNQHVDVPYSEKKLHLKLMTTRSVLRPGAREKWTLHIQNPVATGQKTEVMAGMYDASLDLIMPATDWNLKSLFPVHHNYYSYYRAASAQPNTSQMIYHPGFPPAVHKYRSYPGLNWFGYHQLNVNRFKGFERKTTLAAEEVETTEGTLFMVDDDVPVTPQAVEEQSIVPEAPVRKNFRETAFFYPQLTTTSDSIEIQFTLPEALTEWKLRLLAHTPDLKTGSLTRTLRARKELMVVPNLPRFVRTDDSVEFTAKVVNFTNQAQEAIVTLNLFETTNKSLVNDVTGLKNNQRRLILPPNGSRVVSFPVRVLKDFHLLNVNITAATDYHTDGEEQLLPVIPNTKRITETYPFDLDRPGEKVLQVPAIGRQQVERLTLEYTSNALWYVVQALPYIEPNGSRSTLALINRLFANRVGALIVKNHPEIEDVFQVWKIKQPEALLSPLQKNQELKNILLDKTPWLLDAQNEAGQKQRLAMFFDRNQLAYDYRTDLNRLKNQQSPDGGFSWYPGMPNSVYVTLKTVTMARELQDLGIESGLDEEVHNALDWLGQEMKKLYERKAEKQHDYRLSALEVYYLYALSMFPDFDPGEKLLPVIRHHKKEIDQHWPQYAKMLQGYIALMYGNTGDMKRAESIVASLKEHTVTTDRGMFWRDFRSGWAWYQDPITYQALMIRVFDELTDDKEAVYQMKKWLLNQKRTRLWASSAATTKAIYALLETNETAVSLATPQVRFLAGDSILNLPDAQAGTGYIKQSWPTDALSPEMGTIHIIKTDSTPSWGAVYVQFNKPLEEVETHGAGIKMNKKLYRVTMKNNVETLVPLAGKGIINRGERLRVIITLKTDRNLEFVHLEDGNAAGFEITESLSGYRYQDGLSYYQSVKDAGVDFFIEYMRKGTFVFEYDVFAEQSGQLSLGVATIQSLYAPEFSAHSDGMKILVRP